MSNNNINNNKKTGPGRFGGLSSRPQENARQEGVFDQLAAGSGATRKLPGALFVAISILRSNPYQIRQTYDQAALEDLAADIQERGILEPLIVRELDSGHYEVIAGERRFRAAQLVGLADVPVIVKDYDDTAARFAMLAENIQREDLDPIDEKRFFEQLLNEFNYSQNDIAKLIKKSAGYVRNRLESNLKTLGVVEQNSDNIHKRAYEAQMLQNSQIRLETEPINEVVIERPKERAAENKAITRFKSATFTKFQHTLDDVLLILQSPEARPDAESRQKIQSSIEETRLKLAELENALKNIEGDTNGAELLVKEAAEQQQQEVGKSIKVLLYLRVENNNKFVRGKGRALADIEQFVLGHYGMQKKHKDGSEYFLTINYETDQQLDDIIHSILSEASSLADHRNCFIESDVIAQDGSERSW